MSLRVSAFRFLDPELARLRDRLHEASARLERIQRLHPGGSFDYDVARLGKQALASVAAYASRLQREADSKGGQA